MTESPYPVGYGRPPRNTRFQKGQSGNPGGKPGPKKLLKHDFDAALSAALIGSEEALRQSKPARLIESFARRVVLHALDGPPSAQRLVFSILCEDGDAAMISEEENTRHLQGDRYEAFDKRFDAALAAGSLDDLLGLAREFDGAANSLSQGISQGILENDRDGCCVRRSTPEAEMKAVEQTPARTAEPPARDVSAAEFDCAANSLRQGISQGILKKDPDGCCVRRSMPEADMEGLEETAGKAAEAPVREAAAAKEATLNRHQRRRLASLRGSRDAEEARLGKIAMAALSGDFSPGTAGVSPARW